MAHYRLLVGRYVGNDRDGRERNYKEGSIIDTDLNLLALNAPGMSPKFELINEQPVRFKESGNPTSETTTNEGDFQKGQQDQSQFGPLTDEQKKQIEKTQQPKQSKGQGKQQKPPLKDKAKARSQFESMTVQELQNYCQEEEIDLPKDAKKEDILNTIYEEEDIK